MLCVRSCSHTPKVLKKRKRRLFYFVISHRTAWCRGAACWPVMLWRIAGKFWHEARIFASFFRPTSKFALRSGRIQTVTPFVFSWDSWYRRDKFCSNLQVNGLERLFLFGPVCPCLSYFCPTALAGVVCLRVHQTDWNFENSSLWALS